MGVVHPPWVSDKDYKSTPFNYCDHFGDQKELSLECKICKDDIKWREKCTREGKDPNDIGEALKEVGKKFALVKEMVQRDAKKRGIDLDASLDEPTKKPPSAKRYKIYKLICKYGDKIHSVLKDLEEVPSHANIKVILKAIDVLAHSRTYMIVKIARALNSRWEEQRDSDFAVVNDSKTSALLAYMAIERNSRALYWLANQKPLSVTRRKYLKLAKISIDLLEIIQDEFFEGIEPEYKEFGCDSYNKLFV